MLIYFPVKTGKAGKAWCLGRAAVCDCGTPWTFLLTLFFAPVDLSDAVTVIYRMELLYVTCS